MKLLIATPAYGGLVTTRYLGSLVDTFFGVVNEGLLHRIQILTYDRESLIPRARNKAAHYFLENDFDRMLFIDADMDWTYSGFKSLITSDKQIVGGTYPLKDYPLIYNFNALLEQTDGPQLREPLYFKAYASKYADHLNDMEVRHLPTGFMMIDKSALRHLAGIVPSYAEVDTTTGKEIQYLDFFQTGVRDGKYLSEDWGFCELARSAGLKIYLNLRATCGHTGVHHYTTEGVL